MEGQIPDISCHPCNECGEIFRNHLELIKHGYTHVTQSYNQQNNAYRPQEIKQLQQKAYVNTHQQNFKTENPLDECEDDGNQLAGFKQENQSLSQISEYPQQNSSLRENALSGVTKNFEMASQLGISIKRESNESDSDQEGDESYEVRMEESSDKEDDKMLREPEDKNIEYESDGDLNASAFVSMDAESDLNSSLKVSFAYDPMMSKRYQKNPKMYKCQICPKTYTLKSSVTRHMKVHDGDFICSVCGDNFMDSRSLLKHKKTHNEEILSCLTCGKSFKDKHALARHVAICSAVVQSVSKSSDLPEKKINEEKRAMETRKVERKAERMPVKYDEDDESFSEEAEEAGKADLDPDFELPELAGIRKRPTKIVPDKIILKKTEEAQPVSVSPTKPTPSPRPKSHFCEECDKSFTLRSSLRRHMKKHLLNGHCFQCSDCEKTFSLKSSLQRHYLNKHAPEPVDLSEPLIPEDGEPFYDKTQSNPKLDFCLIPTAPKKEKPFKCFICGNTFGHSSSLQRHLKTHAELGEGSEEKVIQCEICSETFNQFFNLQKHIMEHTGEKPFKCEYCGKSFFENGHLRQHIRTHTGERPYQCDVCSKAFSQGSSLRIHMKLHTTTVSEREYTCIVCSKSFSNYGNMQRHVVKHSGIRPHKCDVCDKAFMEKSHMEKHRVLHTGEKNFICQYCSKAFAQGGNLRQHIKIHTGDKPHICDYCSKPFAENSKLKEHLKIHTGEREYQCDVCSKAFGQKSGLRRHMRKHTGERPYECNECDKIYAHANSLTKHKLRHHNRVEVLIE